MKSNLYLKYRPDSLDKVVGNEQVIDVLRESLKKESPPQAYLFHGPTGCGKTTLARIVAKELGCVGADLVEIDSADFRGIETVREVRKQTYYKAVEGKRRGWILDEVHQMVNTGQSALLKMLEDTPSHVIFILATTNPEKLLKTIKGRCIDFKMERLGGKHMFNLLNSVCAAEKIKLDKEVYKQIIKDSQGHPRNALQILEKVLSVPPDKRLEVAKQTVVNEQEAIELVRALVKAGTPWKTVSNLLNGLKKEDPEGIRRLILAYCSSILLKGGVNDRAGLIMEIMESPIYDGFPKLVFKCYQIVREA